MVEIVERELHELLDRIARGIEHLAEDPVVEMETGPPICPHCQKMNPDVRVQESEGSGPLDEILMRCHCLSCNNLFYAVPVQWDCVKTVEEVQQVISERQELTAHANNG